MPPNVSVYNWQNGDIISIFVDWPWSILNLRVVKVYLYPPNESIDGGG